MKALIIEDSDDLVVTTSLILQIQWPDSRTIATPFGRRGIALTRIEAPDLVILDVGLLDINGLEALRQIRSFSTVPVIVISGSPDPGTRDMALQSGANGYLEKPFDVPQLLALMKVLVGTVDGPGREPSAAGTGAGRTGLPALSGSFGR